MYHQFVDPEEIRRERRKAQELRKSSWWKQQIGKGVCYHCEQRFPKEELTMDHLVPLARGGKTSKKNCVVCCKECNNKKGNRMSVELTMEQMESEGLLPDGEPFGATEELADESEDERE